MACPLCGIKSLPEPVHLKMSGKCKPFCHGPKVLTHWGRVTHLCISKLTSIASDNGLSPGRRQAIIWNNAGILLIGPLGTNFSEILIKIQTFSLKKIRLNMSSAKCRPFCHGLKVLIAAWFPYITVLCCGHSMYLSLPRRKNILNDQKMLSI